ncbi:MAG: metallophosphoesterase [Patescibacteria group bacterium]
MEPKSIEPNIHTLIISDVHLGSVISRADALAELLNSISFMRLIILGDFLDNSNFKRLNASHWKLLTLIQSFSAPESGREIIWVRGNHDHATADTMAHMIGASVVDEYIFEIQGKKFLAIHGDKFAETVLFNDFFSIIGQKVFAFLQHFDKDARHIVKILERSHNFMRRVSSRVARGAIKYAADLKINYVFCGHTHKALEKIYGQGKDAIHYFNTGCWTYAPSAYITIDESGEVALKYAK